MYISSYKEAFSPISGEETYSVARMWAGIHWMMPTEWAFVLGVCGCVYVYNVYVCLYIYYIHICILGMI
jgi:hypothetical protein